MSHLTLSQKKQLVSDHIKVKFLNLVLGQNLHPESAAERIGVPYPLFLALRGTKEGADLEIAWRFAEDNKALLIKNQRQGRKSPMSLTVEFTRKLMDEDNGMAGYVVDMVERAWAQRRSGDKAKVEQADRRMMELLKRRVLSDVIVKASVSQVQEVKGPSEAEFEGMTEDELDLALERAEQERFRFEEILERARIQRANGTEQVQDAVYERCDSPEPSGSDSGESREGKAPTS